MVGHRHPSLGNKGLLRLGSLQPERANAPDLTANQMIQMFWGGLSYNACDAAAGELHKQLWKCPLQGRFHNPDPQTLTPTEGAVLSSLLFL